MELKSLLSQLDFEPLKEDLSKMKKSTQEFLFLIKKAIKDERISAEVFVGGSSAKGTLAKKKVYDVDIFVRFDWKYEDISYLLGRVLLKACKNSKFKLKRVHGSRDYFQAFFSNIIFEVIPVIKIKSPKEARNVTDLSYFHVNYVKRRLNQKLKREVIIAKTFFHAQKAYGAESYIRGFSGYAIECLIIYYKSFEKILKELSKVKDRLIIDLEKKYKKKEDVLFELNESKIHSPLIIVDPTWKERNVTAALSQETFKKFQEAAKAFFKHPNKSFFEDKSLDVQKLRNLAKSKKAEFVSIILETDRQEGDIAGTKLKKFSDFFKVELSRVYSIIQGEFEYTDKKSANLYLIVKPKGEITKIGPPLKFESHVKAFKKANKNTFEKNGFVHSKTNFKTPIKTFIEAWKNKNREKLKEMHITALKINIS